MHPVKFFLPIICMLLSAPLCAQKNEWTVKPGESIRDVLGDSVIYRYPQFIEGKVFYKDGSASRGLLNFNFITGEMQFIAPSKDTLALANEVTIKYITIQSDTFYFDKVYIELIHSSSQAKLGKLEIIKRGDVKKEAAFGQMSSTTAIDAMSSLYGARQTYKLAEQSTITLQRKTWFFVGDSTNHFLPGVKNKE